MEKQSFDSINYKENGRVRYVEPNWNRDLRNVDGELVDAPHDPENLCISVDLQIEVKSRMSANGGDDSETIYLMSWDSNNGKTKLSFFQGTKLPTIDGEGSNSLTTSYTDIHYNNTKNGEYLEGIGISSVDIDFDSWYTPTIVIRFTDVRGASLFSPEEYAHRMDNGKSMNDAAGSFFKCFFSFPYPKYTLQVKGFYGEAVTYQLSCSGFKSSFNSDNGNFESEATFLGYNYSLMTDIPMQMLRVAPYIDYEGTAYWAKNAVLNGRFSIGDGDTKTKMPTLVELCDMVKDAPEKIAEKAANSPLVRTRNYYQAQINKLIELRNAFDDYYNTFFQAKYGYTVREVDETGNKRKLLIFCKQSTDTDFRFTHNPPERRKLIEKVNEYNKVNEGSFKIKFSDGNNPETANDLRKTRTFVIGEGYEISGETRNILTCVRDWVKHELFSLYLVCDDKCTVVKENNLGYDQECINIIRDYLSNHDDLDRGIVTNQSLIRQLKNNTSSVVFDFGGLYEAIQKKIDDFNNEITKTDVDFTKWQESVAKDIFGFKPTIKAIMRIIFAHLETFLYCIYQCRNRINGDGDRTMAALKLNGENSDLNGLGGNVKVPPFPRYMVKSKPTTNNTGGNKTANDTAMEDGWIGNITSYPMEEAKLVYSMVTASQHVGDVIGELRSKITTSDDFFNCEFIPTLLTDTLFTTNPYCYAGKDILTVLSFVTLRMLNYLDQYSMTDSDTPKNIQLAAQCEAMNYFKSHENNDNNFINELESITVEKAINMMNGTDLSWDTTDEKGNYASEITLPNGQRALFQGDNGYRYIRQGGYRDILPVRPMTITDIRSNFFDNTTAIAPSGDTASYYTPSPGNTKNDNVVFIDDNYTNYQSLYNTILNNKIGTVENLSSIVNLWDVGFDNFSDYYVDDDYTTNIVYSIEGIEYSEDIMLPKQRSRWKNVSSHDKAAPITDLYEYMSVDNYGINPTNSTSMSRGSSKMKSVVSELTGGGLAINRCTVANIPIQEGDRGKGSLFGSPFFYLQNEISDASVRIKTKALLFLQTLPININKLLDKFTQGKPGIFTAPKGVLLLMGGYLWRNKYIKENNDDCYVTESGSLKYYPLNSNNGLRGYGDSYRLYIPINGEGSTFNVIDDRLFLLDTEYQNTLIEYFENWVYDSYSAINDALELKKQGTDGSISSYSGEEILELANKVCDAQTTEKVCVIATTTHVGTGVSTTPVYQSNTYNYALLLYDELNAQAFENYQRIYSGDKGRSLTMVLRQDAPVTNEIRDLLIQPVAFYSRRPINIERGDDGKYSIVSTKDSLSYRVSDARLYMTSFLRELKSLYAEKTERDRENADANRPPEGNINTDLCISLYLYLKELNDRWLCGENFDNYTLENFFDRYFKFIDTFYRVVGDELIVNMDYFANSFLNLGDDRNMFSYISDLLVRHGMTFISIPNFNDWAEKSMMRKLFQPLPYHRLNPVEIHPFFICLYTHSPSRDLNLADGNSLYQFKPDTVDIDGRRRLPAVLEYSSKEDNSDALYIPAFGVVFGKQNQSYFKKIDVNMDNPVATEYSIKAYFDIAEQAREGNRTVTFTGQDLYSVWSNNSYTCTVEMLGCAQIQPMMYFQLLNVPMFRGAYQIYQVKHNIRPGYMTTTFKGVRMSSVARPMNVDPFNMVSLLSQLTDNRTNDGLLQTRPSSTLPDGSGGSASNTGPIDNISTGVNDLGFVNPENIVINPESTTNYMGIKHHMKQLFEALRQTIQLLNYPFDIQITSGLRSCPGPESGWTSDHCHGCAMDIKLKQLGTNPLKDEYLGTVFDLIVTYYSDYIGQLIWESKSIETTTLYYPNNCIHWASYGKGCNIDLPRSSAIQAAKDFDDYWSENDEFSFVDIRGNWDNLVNYKSQVFQTYDLTFKNNTINGTKCDTIPFSPAFLKSIAKNFCDKGYSTAYIQNKCISMYGVSDPEEFLRPYLNY